MRKKKLKKAPVIPGSHFEFLNTGIFPATVLFIHGLQYEEIMRRLLDIPATHWEWHAALKEEPEQKFIEQGSYMAMRREIITRTLPNGEVDTRMCFYIIIKPKFKFTDYEFCKLAHEVLHICQYVLVDILDRNKEQEAEAYLHTHLMEQCIKVLRKKT